MVEQKSILTPLNFIYTLCNLYNCLLASIHSASLKPESSCIGLCIKNTFTKLKFETLSNAWWESWVYAIMALKTQLDTPSDSFLEDGISMKTKIIEFKPKVGFQKHPLTKFICSGLIWQAF